MTMNRRRFLALWIDGSNHLMAGAALLQWYEHGMVTWGEWQAMMRGEGVRYRQVAPAVKVA